MQNEFNGVAFQLNGMAFAVDALKVREIVGGANWEPLSVEGEAEAFIQVRGKPARVLDLSAIFGFPPSVKGELNCFITVHFLEGDRNRLAAIWVDKLLDLVKAPLAEVKAVPPGIGGIPGKFLLGFIEGEGEPIFLLDLGGVLREGFAGGRERVLENKAS